MHVNRDEILPVALYQKDEPAIVSPAYMTFEVIDETELLPEFLMMEFHLSSLN
jgi:type I restriction enzyme S subunit